MKRELTVQVGADGVLTLPLGHEDANKTVRVIVETVDEANVRSGLNQEEWGQFVRNMAGRITDPTFDRHPQGEYEQRDTLP